MVPAEKHDDMLTSISEKKPFLKFVEALISDRKRAARAEKENPGSPWGPDAHGWMDTLTESFLESAVAWAADSNFGLDQGLTASNPWRRFAAFVLAGTIYESRRAGTLIG